MKKSHVTCNLRRLLEIGAAQSVAIGTVVEMGLLDGLDRLAEAARDLPDGEVRSLLLEFELIDEEKAEGSQT